MTQKQLFHKARQWVDGIQDERDVYDYMLLLDDLLFQAEHRFHTYEPYADDATFLTRLSDWLDNLASEKHQQALFRLLEHLVFVDDLQMTALYRDAYRRVIGPWLDVSTASTDDLLSPHFQQHRRDRLARFQLASITESFSSNRLLRASGLHGIPRPLILGPDVSDCIHAIERLPEDIEGCIICEDVVGTGKQAGKILRAVETKAPKYWRIIFVPLIAFESGLENLERSVSRTLIRPVVKLPRRYCLPEIPAEHEPALFKSVRGLAKQNASRVMEALDDSDDPPPDPFGYEGSGGLIVTCHNTPNNTLPLVHHLAPQWRPLFRRLHHKDRRPK